jgi:hypothetical protein
MEIFKAVFDGDLLLCKKLLDNGVNVNSINDNNYPYRYSLLMCSILYYQYDIFFELLNRGADINYCVSCTENAISLCVIHHNTSKYFKFLYKLLELKVVIDIKFIISGIEYSWVSYLTKVKDYTNDSLKMYNLIMFADRSSRSDLIFIKNEILNKNFIPCKTWIPYLSKESCLELMKWLNIHVNIKCLLGKNKNNYYNKQYLREQICQEGLPAQNIMSYLEPKYIKDLRYDLSIILS